MRRAPLWREVGQARAQLSREVRLPPPRHYREVGLALAQLWREVVDLQAVRPFRRTLGVVLSVCALAAGLY